MPTDTPQAAVIERIHMLTNREDIHGIIAQMPVPDSIDGDAVINEISPEKDADGLTLVNLGNLLINREGTVPCTPAGIIRLIESTGVQIEGRSCGLRGSEQSGWKTCRVDATQPQRNSFLLPHEDSRTFIGNPAGGHSDCGSWQT